MKSTGVIVLLLATAGCGGGDKSNSQTSSKPEVPIASSDKDPATPEINPENFVSGVTNPYFSIVPGRKFFYDGKSPEGIAIHKELLASDRTKEILGVTTQAVWEREWINDALVSDTKKWYAQDKEGNVWLFGEDDLKIFGGFSKGEGDSWQAGLGNAKAGIVIPGTATAGDSLDTEVTGFGPKKAEILGVSESVTTKRGVFQDCLKVNDVELSQGKTEHHFYCKEAGNLSLELVPDSLGKIELTKVEDNFAMDGMDTKYPPLKVNVSENKAKEIALKEVENAESASSISLETWENKPAYLVQVKTEEDKFVIVFVDVNNGSVLKVFE